MKELKDTFQEIGAKVWYDGAHVLGLIAGGKFQDPLREGADVITGSTHKTLPGPQHGIVLGNTDDDTWKKVQRGVFPGVLSNHHLNTMAALGITLQLGILHSLLFFQHNHFQSQGFLQG